MSTTSEQAADVQRTVQSAVDAALERGENALGVAVFHDGELVAEVCAGTADPETGRQADSETVFWLGSVTKAFTAIALHLQAERGLIGYHDPVCAYWPEFAQHGKDRCTVRDVLSHRGGVPIFPLDGTPERMNDWEWVADRIARAHPLHAPGTANAYHSYTFGWIVGELVRRTDPARRPLPDFLREDIFEPLGVSSLWMGIPPEVEDRVANARDGVSSYVGASPYPFDRVLAVPPALSATQAVFGRSDVRRAGNPGAGAIGDAPSVARVFAMLAGGGELDGVRLLSEDRVRQLCFPRPEGWDYVLGEGTRVGLGGFWIAHPEEGQMAPAGAGAQVIGHPGSGGNIAWADLEHRLAVAITANRTDGGRETPESNPLTQIGDAIRDALGGSDARPA
jgi:CubicO group peptidase (beta-lactamase class C family)